MILRMMDEPERRYMRMVVEFEVEVLDPVAAMAYTMDWARGDDGEVAMAPYPTVPEQIRAAVNQTITEALHRDGPSRGFRWLGGGMLPRLTDGNGDYPELTFPAMPGRRDDGTYAEDA